MTRRLTLVVDRIVVEVDDGRALGRLDRRALRRALESELRARLLAPELASSLRPRHDAYAVRRHTDPTPITSAGLGAHVAGAVVEAVRS